MEWTVEQALEFVQPHMKRARYEHTCRVVKESERLAAHFQVDAHKAQLAAAFHDYAKYKPVDEMCRWIVQDRRLPKDLLHYHHELWHGPVGALMLERDIGLSDPDILSAISSHTTGKKHMSAIDKVVFLADYIEPGRDFSGVDDARKAAQTNLDDACTLALKNTIVFLAEKNRSIYPDTFHAYNEFIR